MRVTRQFFGWKTLLVLAGLFLTVLFSQSFSAREAQAQACPSGTTSQFLFGEWSCVSNTKDSSGNYPITKPDGSASKDPNFKSGASCDFNPGTWDLCLTNIVYVFTVGLMSMFAYIGSYFLNVAVQISLSSNTYAMEFISQGWTVVRDFANMAFLFILIYISFTVMFRAQTSNTMQMLAAVIAVALLVNFSFMLTRMVVDGGNILATQFYNAIQVPTLAESQQRGSGLQQALPAAVSSNDFQARTKDLTYNIMWALNVQNLFNTERFNTWYNSQKGMGFITVTVTLSLIYISVGLAFAIIGFAFLTVAFKFLMRIVVLWFLIIASPLAFISKAMQGSKKDMSAAFDQWMDSLLKFAFYPAIFLFMFWVINLFMQGMSSERGELVLGIFNTVTPGGDFTASLLGSIANVGIRLGFVVVLLWVALRAADFIVVEGTSMGRGFANRVGRGFGWGTYGLVGAVGRNTLGRAGYLASQSNRLQTAAGAGGVKGLGAGLLMRTGGVLSQRSYDARGIPGVTAGLNRTVDASIGKAPVAGDIGNAKDTSFTKSLDTKVKTLVDRGEEIKKEAAGKLDEAKKKAIEKLSPDKKQALANAAERFSRAKKNKEAGYEDAASRAEFKAAGAAFKLEMKDINAAAKKAAGADADAYVNKLAAGISLPFGLGNLVSIADRAAAEKLRSGKNDGEKIVMILKNLGTPHSLGDEVATPAAPAQPAPQPTGRNRNNRPGGVTPEAAAANTQQQAQPQNAPQQQQAQQHQSGPSFSEPERTATQQRQYAAQQQMVAANRAEKASAPAAPQEKEKGFKLWRGPEQSAFSDEDRKLLKDLAEGIDSAAETMRESASTLTHTPDAARSISGAAAEIEHDVEKKLENIEPEQKPGTNNA